MSASAVINTLQQIATKEVDNAAERLCSINKALADELSKLDMLQNYRNDYVDKLALKLTTGLDMQAHQNFQRFMLMLDEAMTRQEEVISTLQVQVKLSQAMWQESQKKKLSYDVLGERSEKKMQLIESRKDQKLMDEFAMRSRKNN